MTVLIISASLRLGRRRSKARPRQLCPGGGGRRRRYHRFQPGRRWAVPKLVS